MITSFTSFCVNSFFHKSLVNTTNCSPPTHNYEYSQLAAKRTVKDGKSYLLTSRANRSEIAIKAHTSKFTRSHDIRIKKGCDRPHTNLAVRTMSSVAERKGRRRRYFVVETTPQTTIKQHWHTIGSLSFSLSGGGGDGDGGERGEESEEGAKGYQGEIDLPFERYRHRESDTNQWNQSTTPASPCTESLHTVRHGGGGRRGTENAFDMTKNLSLKHWLRRRKFQIRFLRDVRRERQGTDGR